MSSGTYNTFIGAASGATTELGEMNTFIGAYSGGDNNRTNDLNEAMRNTYLGTYIGDPNRIGNDNVGIGALADFVRTSSSTNRTRTTFIGADIVVGNNDLIAIGYRADDRRKSDLIIAC